jgi:hypothetical protein
MRADDTTALVLGHRDYPPSRTFVNGRSHMKRDQPPRLIRVHPSRNTYRAVPYDGPSVDPAPPPAGGVTP